MNPSIILTQACFLVVGDVIAYEGNPCQVLQAQREQGSPCIYLHLHNKAENVVVEGPQPVMPNQTLRVLMPRVEIPEIFGG